MNGIERSSSVGSWLVTLNQMVSRRIAILLTLGIVTFAAAGCASGDPIGPTDPEFLQFLIGEWDWESATGGIAGTTRTPASEGFTMRLDLQSQGRIEIFRNDSLMVSTPYQFVPARDLGDEWADPKLTYTDPVLGFTEQSVGLDGNRLVLTDPCCDGFVYRWSPP